MDEERGRHDWQDVLVATVAIVALLLVGVEAWSVFHRDKAVVLPSGIHAYAGPLEDADPAEHAVDSAPPAATDATREPAELAKPVAAASDEKAALSPDAPFHGVVVDPKGAPISGATVQAMDWLGAVAERTATNGAGEFAFGRLQPNSRHLHVSAPGHRAAIVVVGDQGRWSQFPSVSNPARIVLESGVVAVARLQWSDGTPCVGVAVHLGAAKLMTTGIDREPRIGPWPPPVTDANGRVAIDGLPPDRVIGLGFDLLGRNEDSPRPFETGHATAAAEAIEQVFTYPKPAKLTVELRGLEEMTEKRLMGSLSIWRVDGFRGEAQQSVPPFTHTFDPVVLGGQYSLGLNVEGREGREVAHRLKITDTDQKIAFDVSLPSRRDPSLDVEPPRFMARLRLLHPDGSPITTEQLQDVGLESFSMRLRFGSLAANAKGAPAKNGFAELEGDPGDARGMRGRLMIQERPPLWVEAELGSLRSRVEVEKADDDAHLDFTFDLAPLAIGLNRITFRAHHEDGSEIQLTSVLLKPKSSDADLMAYPLEHGAIWRMLRSGSYHYQCFAASGGFAEGDVDVPAGSPVTVDVVLPEPGHITGTVTPMPDALRILVSRMPLHRSRSYFEWWNACCVGPDGNYSLDGVPPGDWRLILTIVAPDETTARIEAATVTVESNAITRHDFVPMVAATKRFRLDLGAARRALVHVTDEQGESVVDGAFTPGALVDLPTNALHFSATPEIRDDRTVRYDADHWTDGTLSAGEGGTTLVRFQFPER